MTPKDRELVYDHIIEHAVSYGIAQASVEHIEQVNILNASMDAMHAAVARLTVRPELLLVDGNVFTSIDRMKHRCIIKGDDKYASIAAASVLAKVSRDRFMKVLAGKYPHYGWETNAGYGTKQHVEGIHEHGITKWHRPSFLSNILQKF